MADKNPKSPATTSSAYDIMAPRWHVIETLLGGTEAMRAAGETYLPKHTSETDEGYRARLSSAVLLNMVEQTLDQLAGKPFNEEIKMEDDVPEALETVLEDVDLQGNELNVFARAWFREGLAKSFCHVLVDMPKPSPREDGKPRTLADDRAEGVRPYWNLIKPECLLFARSEVIAGVETLMHVRILETYTEQDGFADVCRTRIRVLEPGLVQLWEPREGKDDEWKMVEEWQTGLDYIPLVTFYAHREGFMVGKPPLLDLAYLNVTHWQSASDQRHILKVARFPILACSGASKDEDSPVIIGPNRVLYNEDPHGKFYYVEHQGNAIKAGQEDLDRLERQMAGYGAEFLKEKPGDQTATARALDSAEAHSALAAMVVVFEDAVAQALQITAEWMRLDSGGSVELCKEYSSEEADAVGLDALDKARARKDISRKTYLEALRLRGVLPEDFDEGEDQEQLMDEMSALMGAAGMNLDGGAPPDGGDNPEDVKDPMDKKDMKPGAKQPASTGEE